MLARIIADPFKRDSFLHAPPKVFYQLTEGSDGFCACLTCPDGVGSQALLKWMVVEGRTLSLGSNPAQSIRTRDPEIVGNWLIQKHNHPPRLSRVVLAADSVENYQIVARNATSIIEHIFLEQVRIIQKEQKISLWLDETWVSLQVNLIEPRVEFGLVGRDCELEIVTPASQAQDFRSGRTALATAKAKIRIRQMTRFFHGAVAVISEKDVIKFAWQGSVIEKGTSRHLLLQLAGLSFTVLTTISAEANSGWLQVSKEIMHKLGLRQHSWIEATSITPIISSVEQTLESVEVFASCDSRKDVRNIVGGLFATNQLVPIGHPLLFLRISSSGNVANLSKEFLEEAIRKTPPNPTNNPQILDTNGPSQQFKILDTCVSQLLSQAVIKRGLIIRGEAQSGKTRLVEELRDFGSG